MIRAIALLASVTGAATLLSPMAADAVGHIDPLPWQAQASICTACLGLLGYCVARVIPAMAKDNREAVEAVTRELTAFRNDLNDNQMKTAELLRELVTRK